MVAWVKDNSIVFSEASYTIDNIKVYQHGTYICVAVNKFYDDTDGTGSKDLEVVVEHVPFVEIEGQEQPVIEKTNMTIVCSIRDALPNPYRITLYHDDNSDVREIKTEENISGVQFVTFDTDDTDRSMNGTYYCNATTRFYDYSEDSAISDELNLIVHYPPESLLVEDRQVDAILGDKATLTCSFDAYPVATIMWTDVKGGDIASSEVLTGTVITSTIVIPEVKKSHFGDYYCLATNGIDSGILIGIELKEMRKQGVIQWLYSSAIIGGIAIGIVTVVVIFIIFVICLCRRSQEDDRRSSVSDMESLKFPTAKTTTDHSTKPAGVENLGMVRTAPDGTIDHGGITNSEETVMSTFKPKITNKKGETDNTAKTTTGKPPGVTLLKDIQK
ncbi:limbic system-associated membrane protein-like [Glandiceps talaboti]